MLAGLACERAPFRRDAQTAVRIAVIGDFGINDASEAAVAALVHGWQPDIVATVGDNNYPDGAAATIDANIGKYYHDFIAPYTGKYGLGARTNRFFPALGNHDWGSEGAKPYLDYFELPGNERYYSVRRGAVELFVLDSDRHEPDGISSVSVQAQWLRRALAASTARFRIVLLHHPPYSSGEHAPALGLQWPYREWGATAVFAGHDHDYERIDRAGTPYVVIGTGGNRLRKFASPENGSEIRYSKRHGALLIDSNAERTVAQFVTSDRNVIDSFALPGIGDLPTATPLVGERASWKLLAAASAPVGWNTSEFDDASWAVARAPVALAESSGVRHIGFSAGGEHARAGRFLRRAFEVADPTAVGWLELSVPINDDAVAYLNGVQLVLTPHGPHDGAAAPSTYARTLVDSTSLVAGSNLLAVAVRPLDANADATAFDAELDGYAAPTPLIAAGARWRYLDSGITPPPDWSDIGFDDAAWSSGAAPLGYGAADTISKVRQPGERGGASRTTWFRREFSVASDEPFRELLLHVRRGDGGIVFLNGVEITRWNLPDSEVNDATPAVAIGNTDAATAVEIPVAAPLRLDGRNVLAVELHSRDALDPSLAFDLGLVGVR